MDNSHALQIGDTVQLKSGEPLMTVTSGPVMPDDQSAYTAWFPPDNVAVRRDEVPAEALRPVDADNAFTFKIVREIVDPKQPATSKVQGRLQTAGVG